jgi:hypothetical protein
MDQDELPMFYLVFTKLEGAVTSGMIHLGDKLGLYHAMKDAAVPLHSSELAERTGLHERSVREWGLQPGRRASSTATMTNDSACPKSRRGPRYASRSCARDGACSTGFPTRSRPFPRRSGLTARGSWRPSKTGRRNTPFSAATRDRTSRRARGQYRGHCCVESIADDALAEPDQLGLSPGPRRDLRTYRTPAPRGMLVV